MKTPGKIILCLVVCSLIGCGGENHVAEAYSGLLDVIAAEKKPSGRLLGKSGDMKINEGDFRYAHGEKVLTKEEMKYLTEGVRRLYIKKMLLRRIAIENGLDEDIYDTPEAAEYILPRLERIMEEYYYHQEGDFPGIAVRSKKLKPDDAALKEFVKTNPVARSHGMKEKDVNRETDRIISRIAQLRMSKKRREIIEKLIKDSPPMEIFP